MALFSENDVLLHVICNSAIKYAMLLNNVFFGKSNIPIQIFWYLHSIYEECH